MTDVVNRRTYRSQVRKEQAERTRAAILHAARDLLTTEGYGVPVSQIARRAGVAVDTVYASVGRKPELVLAVIDTVLGTSEQPIPAEQRDYVIALRAAATAREKIRIYAQALGRLLPVVAPLQEALREAGRTDEACAEVWSRLDERRAGNMLLFAADLRATGELRADLDDQAVADLVWSTNSAEHYAVLMRRGWTAGQFAEHLQDVWIRALVVPEAWGDAS
ncbi:TetR/AcrR family transcriptional regulator [Demequina capsici]|uniref:TetR/AcrR family transcriptional regulator n=1 Tax=Demequina capsici TaxID=3075620 RepID=A0AA96F6R4_9MICO|nr:TetR/AcrR family transcriptional regulator [Demequina sp. OYTSA14]WNM24334.1 TetR/AcrR family transcriptional regulator [Demequina sp. OYTSA14]